MRRSICITALALFALAAQARAADSTQNSLGRKLGDFALQDYRGAEHKLSQYADKKVVVVCVLGTECPLAKLYAPRLEDLASEFKDRGVQFVALDANSQDSITEIASYARVHGVTFPILKDVGNKIVDQLGATRTPEVFVLDKDRVVRYQGRIDDQYGVGSSTGYAQGKAQKRWLADAIDSVLAGKPVELAHVAAGGCLIGKVREVQADSAVTYSNQIARILQKNCVECHRSGQIAPFALTEYEEVAGWSEMIEEVVRDQRMPPWHADPKVGHFVNDRSLSQEDKDTIYAWVKAGAPQGNEADLPEAIEYPEGWQYRTPEAVYALDKPYTVPAEGTIEYQYFVVDPGWTEDHWTKSTECLIDNRAVVHHVFVFAVPPGTEIPKLNGPVEGGGEFNPGAGGVELIAGAAPGTPPWVAPQGYAGFLPAGTRLVFQMHYTPNGTEQQDQTSVGFTWAEPSEIRHTTHMNMAINFGFRIPANADNHPVEAVHKFKNDSLILNMAPHMHLRGKAFRYDLRYPDGKVETVLNVPRYDFNWQMIYTLAEPKFVPAGTEMRCLAHFDNSDNNLANPDPTSEVRWGDQTWEEMCIGWFLESSDVDPSMIDPKDNRTARFLASLDADPPKVTGLTRKWGAKALASDADLQRFARRVEQLAPQVDRVCATVVDGSDVRVLRVDQPAVFKLGVGDANQTFSASDSALARIAKGNDVVIEQDLSQATAPDLRQFASRAGSSLHVPVTIDGRRGTINFWSRERNAFPPAAVELLTELGRLMGGEPATAQLNK